MARQPGMVGELRRITWACALAGACGSGQSPLPAPDVLAGDATERATPVLVDTAERCKLFETNDLRASNMLGADLGISAVVGDTFYLLFGDTIGYAGIWQPGESHPDAVGYANAAQVAADPATLCGGLGIVTLPPAQSIGPTLDPSVHADFAGAAMIAPDLATYIHNPAGGNGTTFANLPGDFEVPSGAFAHNGSLYVTYTTVASPTDVTMTSGYLARWDAPSPTAIPAYSVLYGLDDPDFINVATVATDDTLYLFGTGKYRASPVSLARKPLDDVDTPGFDRAPVPIIDTPGYGETSVRYFKAIDRWMFLAEELADGHNRIVARFADAPAGPWSDPITVLDGVDGRYGSYLLPDLTVVGDGTFTVAYTLSTFDPYGVALFHATFTSG